MFKYLTPILRYESKNLIKNLGTLFIGLLAIILMIFMIIFLKILITKWPM
jgi:hypothetical protein